MKYKNKLIYYILIFVLINTISAQYYESSENSGIGIPYFDVVIHNKFDKNMDGYDVLVLTQFIYDDLTFIKSDTSGYDASFELLIAVYDEKENVIFNRTINKHFNVKDFDLTNNRDEKILIKSMVDLEPGNYIFLLKALDISSNQSASRRINFTLKDYKLEPIFISGISFLQDVKWDSSMQVKSFNPTIGNNFTARDGIFYIYFDLYTQDVSKPVDVRYSLSNKKSGTELDSVISISLQRNISSHYYKIEKDDLKRNRYLLEISTKQGKHKAKAEKNFSFYWTDVPGTHEDIDVAFQQMRYIIPHDSLNKYKNSDLNEKQGYFKRFWNLRDPNPNTTKNELKDEYFKRINYANRNFTAFGQDGWLTDRGRILIKFGYPDDIERHPFEMGTQPYQIWRYYALRKTFVFIDQTGFGDYRLHMDYLDVEFQ
jgi:GWxTD domain-containing protein